MKYIIFLLFLIGLNFIIIGYYKELYKNRQKIVYKYLPTNSLDLFYQNNNSKYFEYLFNKDNIQVISN